MPDSLRRNSNATGMLPGRRDGDANNRPSAGRLMPQQRRTAGTACAGAAMQEHHRFRHLPQAQEPAIGIGHENLRPILLVPA